MRVYGRQALDPLQPDVLSWVVVETTPNGLNDACYATALAQTCKLNLNESPFWANFGIPAKQSVISQIMPDLYIVLIQKFYQQFFTSLIVAKVPSADGVTPQYTFSITTSVGFTFNVDIGAQ